MSDIATLGIAVDTTAVKAGAADLDKLTDASARTEAATSKLSATTQQAAAASQTNNSATQAMAEAINRAESASTRAAASGDAFVAAQNREYAARVRVALAVKEQELATEAAAAVTRAAAAEYARLEAEIEKLTTSSSKSAAASALLGKAQETLNAGVARGVVSQQAATGIIEDLTKKYGGVAEGAGKATISSGYLTREIRALGDEISSGRYRQADGTFVNLATRLTGLGGAALGVVGAVAAVAVGIGLLVARNEALQRSLSLIEVGFKATGNAGLISRDQIKLYIDQLALLPGVSRDAAEKSITELSRVPYVTGPLFAEATKHLGDYAALLGTDVAKAAKVAAEAIADPGKAAKTLDEQFNLLTVSQRLTIEEFVKQGDNARATTILLDALNERSKGLEREALTPLQKAINDVAVAFDRFMKSLSDNGTIAAIGDHIVGLISKVNAFILAVQKFNDLDKEIFEKSSGLAAFRNPQQFAIDQSELGGGDSSLARALANATPQRQVAVGGPQYQFATPNAGGDMLAQALAGQQAAQRAAQEGQSQATRSLLDRTQNDTSKVSRIKQDQKDIADLTALLKDQNLTQENKAGILDRIAGIQEKIGKLTPKTPLGLNVDTAQLEQALKAIEAENAAEKDQLAERQKYIDFYHKVGITSDEEYNRSKDAANNDYLAKLQANFAREIAAVDAEQAALKAKRAQNPGQRDQIDAALVKNQTERNKLLAEEDRITQQIGNDNKFRADTAGIIKNQEDFNRALKETQELTSDVSVVEQRTNLEVQLGLKTQFDGIVAVTQARQATIEKLQAQLAVMQQIHDTEGLDPASPRYIEEAKAIDKVNIALLQMKAELDPVGKALNQAFNQDLNNFFDKFATGGIKSFKDLKAAALDFVGSIGTTIAKQANAKLADSIMQSLGGQADSATGGAGGLGGVVSRALGYTGASSSGASGSVGTSNGAASNDPMGDFIKNIDTANGKLDSLSSDQGGLGGAAKSVYSFISKQILGTTAQTSATSASASTTTALTSLTQAAYAAARALSSVSPGSGSSSSPGLGSGASGGGFDQGAFDSNMAGGQSALASTSGTAGGAINAGVTDEALALFHGGGVVGEASMFKQVRYSAADAANAPRFHGGGIAGLAGYEQMAVLKKGEEVVTEDDPRHRKNGGRTRGGMSLVQNFTVQPTESRSSQAQIAARASAGINSAAARSRG